MSFAKNPEAYPPALKELFIKAATSPSRLTIPCGDRKKAKYLQMRLHAYKYAVCRTKSHEHYLAAINFAKQLIIDEENNLIIQHVSESKDNALIQGYLANMIEEEEAIPQEVLAAANGAK